MKIVIVGAGRVGYAIAEQLLTEGHDITVVEGDPERAAYISSTLDVIVVEGRANVDQLRIANVADADLLIAATTSDETNLISCMVGRKLGATHTIARVRAESQFLDVPLKALKLKDSVLVASIIRRGKCRVPSGNDAIELGDRVVVVTTNHGMHELKDILK